MILLILMNLGFGMSAAAAPTFKPVWAANRNTIIGQTSEQPVQK